MSLYYTSGPTKSVYTLSSCTPCFYKTESQHSCHPNPHFTFQRPAFLSPAPCSWEVGFLQELNPTTSFARMSRGGREIRSLGIQMLLKVGKCQERKLQTALRPPVFLYRSLGNDSRRERVSSREGLLQGESLTARALENSSPLMAGRIGAGSSDSGGMAWVSDQ